MRRERGARGAGGAPSARGRSPFTRVTVMILGAAACRAGHNLTQLPRRAPEEPDRRRFAMGLLTCASNGSCSPDDCVGSTHKVTRALVNNEQRPTAWPYDSRSVFVMADGACRR